MAKAKKASPKGKVKKKEEAISTAWNLGKTMTLHSVKVGGKSYKSTWQAWKALNVGTRGQCIRFRAALKKLGVGKKLAFETAAGKKIEFTLTKPATPE